MGMRMAKASKDDIQRLVKFFQFIEEYMEYGTHTPKNEDPDEEEESIDLTEEEFVEKLRVLWGGRFKPEAVDCSWCRVVLGCEILIDNVCDPALDYLELRPEWKAVIDKLEESEKPTAEKASE